MSDRNYYWLVNIKWNCHKWFIFSEEQMRDMDIEDFHVLVDPSGASKDLVVVSDGS